MAIIHSTELRNYVADSTCHMVSAASWYKGDLSGRMVDRFGGSTYDRYVKDKLDEVKVPSPIANGALAWSVVMGAGAIYQADYRMAAMAAVGLVLSVVFYQRGV